MIVKKWRAQGKHGALQKQNQMIIKTSSHTMALRNISLKCKL